MLSLLVTANVQRYLVAQLTNETSEPAGDGQCSEVFGCTTNQ